MMIWSRLKYLWPAWRRREEREMREELGSLIEIAGGRKLGNLTLAMEDVRATWGCLWLDSILADIRYSFRALLRQRLCSTSAAPHPTILVEACIAFGGALTAAAAPLLAAGFPGLGVSSPGVYTLVPLALLTISAVASYVPARRAAGFDPLRALRNE
jgi:hypothetical protein